MRKVKPENETSPGPKVRKVKPENETSPGPETFLESTRPIDEYLVLEQLNNSSVIGLALQ